MPTTKTFGTPGDANKSIGGVPKMHYFDFASRGRGQVVRLMWEDAGIAYEDVRYTFEEFPKVKEQKIAQMNPATTIPVIELNGKILVQSYAILRHFARQLGKYDGETEEEKYWADAMCDLTLDWRTLFIQAFFSPNKEETYPKHEKGPFVTGKNITYADMVIYQICHDENLTQDARKGLKGYPRLTKLVDAVEERPNVKAFLESDRYLG